MHRALGSGKGTSTLLKREASLRGAGGVASEPHSMGRQSDHWLSGASVAVGSN